MSIVSKLMMGTWRFLLVGFLSFTALIALAIALVAGIFTIGFRS